MDQLAKILLVEDNFPDQIMVKEALKDSCWAKTPVIASDGEEAISFLHQMALEEHNAPPIRPFEKNPLSPYPDLIILDLNLPKKDGREVLAEIKKDPRFRWIPIVILTSSKAPSDINHCYDAGANCYLTKPADLEEYFTMMRNMEIFWFSQAKLPTAH